MANVRTTVVHVTHEATGKIGGIGAVLQGFFTSNAYLEAVDRSILVGPLFSSEGSVLNRLGENGEVLYSSVDGLVNTEYKEAFSKIEKFYNAGIVYGRRAFVDKETGIKSSPEVLLIDVRHMDNGPVNEFKKHLFKRFGIQSHLYEHSWEYEQYLRLAPPAIDALRAIGAAADSTIIVSHEFMGMPTALSAIMEPGCNFKTAFYAHEVATMRRIIEEHPGHDTMFYNAINHNHGKTKYAAEMFGDQSYYFKHVLVEASRHCDAICAVGDSIVDELRFLAPEFQKANINIVYNGIPAYKIGLHEKLESKRKLQQYCENLLGYKPDFVFTHVTRLVRSKGLWRDLQVLEHIEKEFRANGNTGVMFVLSTEVSQRQSNDIIEMESAYNWPAAHREGSPDLSGGEANFYAKVQEFNARSRNIKVVFINQFGFERRYCGMRMPSDMEFLDIRKGSDVEFGLSIYEPFGISQLEPLTFGGICVASGVCGCVGFVRDTANGKPLKNVIIADYTKLDNHYSGIENYQQIGMAIRKAVEEDVSEKIAMQIILQLPKDENEMQILLQEGYQLAKNMSWDMVVKKYLLQTLRTALQGQGRKFMCPHS